MRDGIRFVPAGITLDGRDCEPFAKDPNRTTRERIDQVPLSAASAEGMRAPAPPRGTRSRCSISECVESHPRHVLRIQDACLHNDTLYLLSDRDTPAGAAPLLEDDTWGDPKRPRKFRRFFREVSAVERIPAARHVWLDATWAVVTPKFRFGKSNIFHAVLEEIGWLGAMTRCARIGTGASMRYLTKHHRKLLGRSTTGRLWEIAMDGARTLWIPPEDSVATAFCFRKLHYATDLPNPHPDPYPDLSPHPHPIGSVGELHSATGVPPPSHLPFVHLCARVDALTPAPPPAWPGWPAGQATFTGFRTIVARARARLGLLPEAEAVGAKWAVPRVTVVHRLRNRRLTNIAYVAWALRDAGFAVTLVSLECMPLEPQLAVVSNSTTLLGVHGAGLTLGHALPPDALVLELRSAPCAEEARGVPYQMRAHSEIVPAPRVAVMPNGTCPPPWKYNSRHHDAVVDIDAVLRAIYAKDPVAKRQRGRWPKLPPRRRGT
jgi:hypothetical protein